MSHFAKIEGVESGGDEDLTASIYPEKVAAVVEDDDNHAFIYLAGGFEFKVAFDGDKTARQKVVDELHAKMHDHEHDEA